jgi:hypothetical protein
VEGFSSDILGEAELKPNVHRLIDYIASVVPEEEGGVATMGYVVGMAAFNARVYHVGDTSEYPVVPVCTDSPWVFTDLRCPHLRTGDRVTDNSAV